MVLEEDEQVVRKTFHAGSRSERRKLATEEHSRLFVLWKALQDVPGAICPRPLGLVEDPDLGFRMTWVSGERLIDRLTEQSLPEDHLVRLGATTATALRAYVERLGEPYHDFKLENFLLESSGSLVFLDLGLPQDYEPPDADESPYESSVANLLASLVFESARPKRLLSRRLHRQSAVIARALVAKLVDEGAALETTHLVAAAQREYLRATSARRSVIRTTWYATVGWTLGRRIRLGSAHFGPVPPWRGRRRDRR